MAGRTCEPSAPPSLGEPPRRARALAQTAAALQRAWAIVDAVLAALAMLLAHQLSPVYSGSLWTRETLWAAGVNGAAFTLAARAVGFYDFPLGNRRSGLALRCLAAAAFAGGITLAFFYIVFYRPIGRWAIAVAIGLTPLLVLPLRAGLRRLLLHRPRRILFVGKSLLADRMATALAGESEPLYEIVGEWPAPGPQASPPDPALAEDLMNVCRDRDVDELVLASSAVNVDGLLLPALTCLPLGCRIRSETDFYEDIFQAVPLVGVTPEWMFSRGWDSSDHPAAAIKRVSDIVLAGLILLALSPLGLVAMGLIKATSAGPVLYTQVRVGRYGNAFRILKLRTMHVGAEGAEPLWSPPDDPRRTRVGRLLRRMRIDELPQVLNVFRGDMSFVGPRPERPEFVEQLERALPYYSWRHLVRPGLTGWAQINHPYGATVDDAARKLEYDLYYVRHASLAKDLGIVLRTVSMAMRGAR